jgi:hypothetical protein
MSTRLPLPLAAVLVLRFHISVTLEGRTCRQRIARGRGDTLAALAHAFAAGRRSCRHTPDPRVIHVVLEVLVDPVEPGRGEEEDIVPGLTGIQKSGFLPRPW